MSSRPAITAERLRELLDYDRETGIFRWRVKNARVNAGDIAGTVAEGRVKIKIDQRQYKAHRLAWLHVHGRWPEKLIDHRDGDATNNRLSNLREATHTLNLENQRAATARNRSTGVLGVSVCGRTGKFVPHIKMNRVMHNLGAFTNLDEARETYVWYKRMFHAGCTI